MNLCMAATYDPDPRRRSASACRSTWKPASCIGERWRNWLRHDPVNLVTRTRGNLKLLRGDLHRLRLARPVPHPLRQPASLASGSQQAGIAHPTRNSTTITRTSTTAWTRACRSCTAPCVPEPRSRSCGSRSPYSTPAPARLAPRERNALSLRRGAGHRGVSLARPGRVRRPGLHAARRSVSLRSCRPTACTGA